MRLGIKAKKPEAREEMADIICWNTEVNTKLEEADHELPIHVVLGVNEYAAIKTRTAAQVGIPGQPVAEHTHLGWIMMSHGREEFTRPLLLTQSTSRDYEQLCALDVLGLADVPENDQETVYQGLKEQLEKNQAGWYETRLPWKRNHPPLPTNEAGSRRRLEQLIRKLQRNGNHEDYNNIIQERLQQGVIEPAPTVSSGKEYYIPHKGVSRPDAESTKLRVVYDASARENNNKPSLNDCLHPGPLLQNLLWSILVQSRFYPVVITGDLRKTFLQVRIKLEDRDSLRFHWREHGSTKIKTYCFTRALFGLTSSSFLLSSRYGNPDTQKSSKSRALKSNTLSARLAQSDVIPRSHAETRISHALTFLNPLRPSVRYIVRQTRLVSFCSVDLLFLVPKLPSVV